MSSAFMKAVASAENLLKSDPNKSHPVNDAALPSKFIGLKSSSFRKVIPISPTSGDKQTPTTPTALEQSAKASKLGKDGSERFANKDIFRTFEIRNKSTSSGEVKPEDFMKNLEEQRRLIMKLGLFNSKEVFQSRSESKSKSENSQFIITDLEEDMKSERSKMHSPASSAETIQSSKILWKDIDMNSQTSSVVESQISQYEQMLKQYQNPDVPHDELILRLNRTLAEQKSKILQRQAARLEGSDMSQSERRSICSQTSTESDQSRIEVIVSADHRTATDIKNELEKLNKTLEGQRNFIIRNRIELDLKDEKGVLFQPSAAKPSPESPIIDPRALEDFNKVLEDQRRSLLESRLGRPIQPQREHRHREGKDVSDLLPDIAASNSFDLGDVPRLQTFYRVLEEKRRQILHPNGEIELVVTDVAPTEPIDVEKASYSSMMHQESPWKAELENYQIERRTSSPLKSPRKDRRGSAFNLEEDMRPPEQTSATHDMSSLGSGVPSSSLALEECMSPQTSEKLSSAPLRESSLDAVAAAPLQVGVEREYFQQQETPANLASNQTNGVLKGGLDRSSVVTQSVSRNVPRSLTTSLSVEELESLRGTIHRSPRHGNSSRNRLSTPSRDARFGNIPRREQQPLEEGGVLEEEEEDDGGYDRDNIDKLNPRKKGGYRLPMLSRHGLRIRAPDFTSSTDQKNH